jgi:hypothetical protein
MDRIPPELRGIELRNRLECLRFCTPSQDSSAFYKICGNLVNYLVHYCSEDARAVVDILTILDNPACTSIYVEKIKVDIQSSFSTFDEHCLQSRYSHRATEEFGVRECNYALVAAVGSMNQKLRHLQANSSSDEVARGTRKATARTVLYAVRGVIVRKALYDDLVDPAKSSEFWDHVISIFEIIDAQLLPPSLQNDLRDLIEIIGNEPEFRRMRDPNLFHGFRSLIR